jgi:ABC-type Zn uptake system ZnuABC Zn-binding protein ZnuA
MKNRIHSLAALVLVGMVTFWAATASAKIKVAASITDLGSIAASVGGDLVECFAIARPTSDVHRVEVLPSYMVRVSKADVYLKVGMGLDQWADQIIDGSRNDRLKIVDCSLGIDALEKPTAKVTALQGDVHPYGNPHYWLDPRNGAIVAHEVADALSEVDPEHAAKYHANADAFGEQAEVERAGGQKVVAALPSRVIITYHASWVYFEHAFGLEIAGTAEPVPGIPPTGKHLQELVTRIQQRRIGIFLQEPYFSDDAGKFLARQSGLRVIKASPSCDNAEPESYLSHIRQVVEAMASPSGQVDGR